jgi:radical SAM protein with 4Fe4S-binding SPASM domain
MKPTKDNVYQCGGGVTSFAIDPYGQLSICVLSEAHKYDVRAGSFRDGWDGFLHQQRTRKVTRPTKCVACTLKSVCGMCPANGELESGDPETPVDCSARPRTFARWRSASRSAPTGTEYCDGGSGYAQMTGAAARLRNGAPGCSAADHDRQ